MAQELPFPGQQFVQTRCGKIGDTGEDVGEPGLRKGKALWSGS